MSDPFFVSQFNLGASAPSESNYEPDDPHGIIASLRRKRERDRHSQRRKRQRERDYVNDLRKEVRVLKQTLSRVKCSCGEVPDVKCDSEKGGASDAEIAAPSAGSDISATPEVATPQSLAGLNQDFYNMMKCVPTSFDAMEKMMEKPPWLRLPPYTTEIPYPNIKLTTAAKQFIKLIADLRANPDMISLCPSTPRTLDILFGGSSNVLANYIASQLQAVPFMPPERFAYSWFTYIYVMWLVWPTPEHFEALPEHLRPTHTQLTWEHPLWYDFFIWPEMRDNLIKNGSKHDLAEVFGLLACTGRIRGGFNRPFITRENDGEPHVREDFYQEFLKRSSWGILEKFWIDYPELVEGMDRGEMITEEDLIPL